MTEQNFQTQHWRMYDQITTADGIKGKVLGVSFTTKSVRAFISGAPEWVKCELIESHTSGKGGECDDATIIEQLHGKVINQASEIERLREEKKELADKISHNYLGDLLKAINIMQQGLQEKKKKMEQIESGLKLIQDALAKIEITNK
jgi:hypothetical protein